MNSRLTKRLTALACLVIAPIATFAACACGEDCKCDAPCTCSAEDTPAAPAEAGHPLRGVVESILTERQSLLVKHEAIPGVMRAMTMMLRVQPEVFERVKAGDQITAQLHHGKDGIWSLSEVQVVKE